MSKDKEYFRLEMSSAFHSRLMDGCKVVSIDSLGSSKLTPYTKKKRGISSDVSENILAIAGGL